MAEIAFSPEWRRGVPTNINDALTADGKTVRLSWFSLIHKEWQHYDISHLVGPTKPDPAYRVIAWKFHDRNKPINEYPIEYPVNR